MAITDLDSSSFVNLKLWNFMIEETETERLCSIS